MPERRLRRWTRGRRGGLTVALLYLAGSLILTLGAWRGPTSGWAGGCCDPEQAMWNLGWTPHALSHGLNPFFTTQIGAPEGVNVMWSPSMPLLGILGWLPSTLGGPVFGFNVLMAAGVTLSGWTAWLAIRRWTGDGAGPMVGGAVYAFSPFIASHAALHLNLATAWVPPLLLITLDELLVTRHRPAWQSGAALGALAAAQLLISEEVLATSVIAGAVLVAVLAVTHLDRPIGRRLITGCGAALVTFLTLAAWPLAAQFFGPQRISAPVQNSETFSTDLLNLVLPTAHQLLAPHAATRVSGGFSGLDHEATAYLGVPMLALIVVAAVRYRSDPRIRVATVTGAAMLVLSLGPRLHIGATALPVPLPWAAVAKLPLLGHALPGRMTVFVWLAVAVIVATVITRATRLNRAPAARWQVAVAVALVALLPTPLTRAQFTTPAFFHHWAEQGIGSDETVLVAPYFVNGNEAAPMVWAAVADYGLRMPEAYAYVPQPDGGTYSGPAQSQLTFTMDQIQQTGHWLVARGDIRAQIAADLDATGVRHVIVGPTRHWRQLLAFFTDLFGRPPTIADEVAIWRDAAVRPATEAGAH